MTQQEQLDVVPDETNEAAPSELDETREQLLRVSAELENYRKRSRRELEERQKYAESALLRDLLPVIDNLRRAETAATTSTDHDEMLSGVRMITGQLQDILARHHCEEIPAAGQPFDPTVHEAVTQIAVPDTLPGTIVEVIEPGYRLHDRVLRPSRVVVSG